MSTFEELLARDGKLVYKTKGVSMEPMLRQDRDLVVIERTTERLRPYDVAFYKRGSSYVLHRVIEVKEGGYRIRGDNTYAIEHVPEDAVLGVLTAFVRKGKQYQVTDSGYRRYVRFWCAIYPVRFGLSMCRRLAVRVARRTGITPLIKRLMKHE